MDHFGVGTLGKFSFLLIRRMKNFYNECHDDGTEEREMVQTDGQEEDHGITHAQWAR